MSEDTDVVGRLFSGQQQLPTLPVLFYEFCKLMDRPDLSHRQVADLIMRDPAMATRVLRLSNSAIYSNVRETTSLKSAVIFLGLETLKKLILQISLVRLFPGDPKRLPQFSVSLFWEHALAAAHFADMLAARLGLPAGEDHYLGGLLHDIGKLALYHAHPAAFAESVRLQIDEGLSDVDAERRVLGADHAEIGAFLAEKWKFRPALIRAIGRHHRTVEAGAAIDALVRVANLFAKAAGLCFPWDNRAMDIVGDSAWQLLAADCEGGRDVAGITFDLMDRTDEVRRTVRLMLARGGDS